MIYKLFEHVHLDRHNKTYHKLIAINEKPKDGSLDDIVKVVGRNKLSVHHDYYNDEGHCVYVFNYTNDFHLTHKKQSYPMIEINDIANALTLLAERGYEIENTMTNFLQKRKNDKYLICFIKKS